MRDDIAMEVKPFIVLSAKGDLPTNPTSLRECLVCGGMFTHEQSRTHSEVRCRPSPEQPFSFKGRGSKPWRKTQICQ
jgi:hypothetical protein